MAQKFDYTVSEDGKYAEVQSAGKVNLDRPGSREEIIKNYIQSVLNIDPKDVELNRVDDTNKGVITSNDADTTDNNVDNPVANARKNARR